MHIVGIGTDIVALKRIRRAPNFDRILEYVCVPSERVYIMEKSRSKTQSLGTYFAVKEAVIKAFPAEIGYQHITLQRGSRGLTVSVDHASSDEYQVLVSLAHEFAYVVSTALVYRKSYV